MYPRPGILAGQSQLLSRDATDRHFFTVPVEFTEPSTPLRVRRPGGLDCYTSGVRDSRLTGSAPPGLRTTPSLTLDGHRPTTRHRNRPTARHPGLAEQADRRFRRHLLDTTGFSPGGLAPFDERRTRAHLDTILLTADGYTSAGSANAGASHRPPRVDRPHPYTQLQGRKGKAPPLPGKTCATGRSNDVIHAKS